MRAGCDCYGCSGGGCSLMTNVLGAYIVARGRGCQGPLKMGTRLAIGADDEPARWAADKVVGTEQFVV